MSLTLKDKIVKFFGSVALFENPWSDWDIVTCCRLEAEDKHDNTEKAVDKMMKYSVALVHSDDLEHIQEGVRRLEECLDIATPPLSKMEKLYFLSLGYYRGLDFERSAQFLGECLQIEPDFTPALNLMTKVKDEISGVLRLISANPPAIEPELNGLCQLPSDINQYPDCYVRDGFMEASLLLLSRQRYQSSYDPKIIEKIFRFPRYSSTVYILVDGAYRSSISARGERSGVGGVVFEYSRQCTGFFHGFLLRNYGNDYAEVASAFHGFELGISMKKANIVIFLDNVYMCEAIEAALWKKPTGPLNRAAIGGTQKSISTPVKHLIARIVEMRDQNKVVLSCRPLCRELNFSGDLLSRVERVRGTITFRHIHKDGTGLFNVVFQIPLCCLIKRMQCGKFLKFVQDQQGNDFNFVTKKRKRQQQFEDYERKRQKQLLFQ